MASISASTSVQIDDMMETSVISRLAGSVRIEAYTACHTDRPTKESGTIDKATTETRCLRSRRSAALKRAALTVCIVRMSRLAGEFADPPAGVRGQGVAGSSEKTRGAPPAVRSCVSVSGIAASFVQRLVQLARFVRRPKEAERFSSLAMKVGRSAGGNPQCRR